MIEFNNKIKIYFKGQPSSACQQFFVDANGSIQPPHTFRQNDTPYACKCNLDWCSYYRQTCIVLGASCGSLSLYIDHRRHNAQVHSDENRTPLLCTYFPTDSLWDETLRCSPLLDTLHLMGILLPVGDAPAGDAPAGDGFRMVCMFS